MTGIRNIVAREILDSRGKPTVEVDVFLLSGHMGRMMVPSGASTGKFEAKELRDHGKRFGGNGVTKAVDNVNTVIRKILKGKNAEEQETVDELMIGLDGTADKSNLGANAILGVSGAVAYAAAHAAGKPLYQYLSEKYLPPQTPLQLPVPMVNIISGGRHAGMNLDVQDFLIVPLSPVSYPETLEMISAVYRTTRDVLNKKGYNAFLLADEGGFGPQCFSNKEALDILMEVFHLCGYKAGQDIAIALDIASSEFYNSEKNSYELLAEKRSLTFIQMIGMLQDWTNDYPVISIEDGLAEDDWHGWQALTEKLGNRIQLIGDDLFTTNKQRLQKGIDTNSANAILIKMNQVGTLTETVHVMETAKRAGFKTIISARSGETEDAIIADLAVGLNAGQIKIGSLAGSSRTAKYNQLLRIHEHLKGRYTDVKKVYRLN